MLRTDLKIWCSPIFSPKWKTKQCFGLIEV